MTESEVIEMCRVKPGSKVRLAQRSTDWEGDESRPLEERKRQAKTILSEDTAALSNAQELLYASDSWSVLVVFQAMDAAGKDGAIKHVMSGVNPQGCQVFSFKQPSAEELDHNFLWRYSKRLPERGRIGIFNRSYYEEVLVVKVHPRFVEGQRIPDANPAKKKFWKSRYKDINNFEKHLAKNGTCILKFFLHISKAEQKRRFLDRLNDPTKHWKFSESDLTERGHWNDYMKAYEKMLEQTSTDWAPWYVVPADHKWVARAIISRTLTRTIESLGLQYPEVTPDQLTKIESARQSLTGEAD